MIRQALSVASTESRMARRTWRFWLTLGLLAAILYFAWKDHVRFVEHDMYLAPDHSFGNRAYSVRTGDRGWSHREVFNYSASLTLAAIWLGAVAIALESCGRLRRTGMDKILFPRPFGTMSFVLGQYLGVLLVMVPLAALPWLGFGLLQETYGHANVVWQPFILCYLLLVLPVLLTLAAMALWVRLVFKHDIVAIVFMLVLIGAFSFFGREITDTLSVNYYALRNSSPALGAVIDMSRQPKALGVLAAFTITFLLLAPFHLRRQEPQRRILRRRGYRWFTTPTFLRWISDLKMDRNLPVLLKLSAFLCVLTVGGGAVYGYLQIQEREQTWEAIGEAVNALEKNPPPKTPMDVLSYDTNVDFDFGRNRLACTSDVHLRSATDDLSVLRFSLNREQTIQELTGPDGELEYERQAHLLTISLPEPLEKGQEYEFRLVTDGKVGSRYGGAQPIYREKGWIEYGKWWYPVVYIPEIKVEKYNRTERHATGRPDLFDATVTATIPKETELVFPGMELAREDLGVSHRMTYRTANPLHGIDLLWGRYDLVDEDFSGLPCRFYHLPGHQYQALVCLEELRDSQEEMYEKLGPVPLPRLTFCEIPMHSHYYPQDKMPGIFTVNESELAILHEGIWALDRYDTKPSEVDFYERLQPTVHFLNWNYREFLVDTYFGGSFRAAGPYGFWLDAHLSRYIERLFDPNEWSRRRQLNYDVGAQANLLASSVARPLLENWKENPGQQPVRVRSEGIYRMLHHLLDDEGWWKLMRRLLQEYRFKDVTHEDFIRLANEVYGEPLDWFFEQWLYGDVLPRYEITSAEATLMRLPGELRVKYDVKVTVKNHGTGKMAVPIYINTDRDHVIRDLWLDGGEENTLSMMVPHRPLFAAVDPENWVLQEVFYDENTKSRGHSEKKFFIIQPKDLEEAGKERLTATAEGDGAE